MTGRMRALCKTTPSIGLHKIETDIPILQKNDILVKVETASICGTDVHIYQWDEWAKAQIAPPRIIGHEICGTIVELGSQIKQFSVGDRVASESHFTCGTCIQCKKDQKHVCQNTRILGVHVDGGFADYVILSESNARKVSQGLSPRIACMQDAIGNAVHTLMEFDISGQNILITGLGPIGLFAVAICKLLGANKIIATEISPLRTQLGYDLGADQVFHPIEHQKEFLNLSNQFDVCLEMSGHASSLELASELVRSGGGISQLGLFSQQKILTPMNNIVLKGQTLKGITGRKIWKTWDQMEHFLSNPKLDLSPIITHEFALEDFEEAFEIIQTGKAAKVIFNLS